jgi:hypothetical protein
MKIVVGRGTEIEDGAIVYIPRPLSRNVLESILEKASLAYMPPSTYDRISRRVKERFGEKIRIESIRGRFAYHDPEIVARIAALRKSGMSIRKIAEEVGLPKSTVHYILSRMKKLEVAGEKIIL